MQLQTQVSIEGLMLRPLPSQPWFPHAPLKVARANMDRGGIPGVEKFIDRRGLRFQPLPLARGRERGQGPVPSADGSTSSTAPAAQGPQPRTVGAGRRRLRRWERTVAPACQIRFPSTQKVVRQKEKGETHEPGPTLGPPWLGLGGLGLTLAWYSLMKGWDLWASFSWDR